MPTSSTSDAYKALGERSLTTPKPENYSFKFATDRSILIVGSFALLENDFEAVVLNLEPEICEGES